DGRGDEVAVGVVQLDRGIRNRRLAVIHEPVVVGIVIDVSADPAARQDLARLQGQRGGPERPFPPTPTDAGKQRTHEARGTRHDATWLLIDKTWGCSAVAYGRVDAAWGRGDAGLGPAGGRV